MKRRRFGTIFPVIVALLSVMMLMAMGLSRRFSGQARLMSVADHSMIARYFLESYAGDILWQIRKQRNKDGSEVFKAFRSGTGVPLVEFAYRPSPLLAELARNLRIEMGPDKPVAFFAEVEALPFSSQIFKVAKGNEEKRGTLGITCQITFEKKQYTMEVRSPFKVVLQVTPVLRKFLLFFDQFHLEQSSPIGDQDRVNLLEIKNSQAKGNVTPLTIFGDPRRREANGNVFLGSDEHKIYLNLVGGRVADSGINRGDLTDLWQISPSAFDVTSGYDEFAQQELMCDSENKPILVRGAQVPLAYQGHYSHFGILGFSEEIGAQPSPLLGDFKLANFLNGDPSFVEFQRFPESLKKSSLLRLNGDNFIGEGFKGYPRDIYGNVYSRFMLLSFFYAPSVGSPIAFSTNPNQTMSFDQYANAEMITFKPKSGNYGNFMSRIVSGGKASGAVTREASVWMNRDKDWKHKHLQAGDFPECDGLRLAGPFSRIGKAWFPDGPYNGPGGRPGEKLDGILGRICRYFKTQADFKKFSGLQGPGDKRFWVDGVVYVHEGLDLREGIDTKDLRGGIVLVRGPITLGNVTRGFPVARGLPRELGKVSQNELLTFVSLTGDKITLTGNRYFGVQVISLRPELVRPLEQIGFEKGSDFIFLGGMGLSTPRLESLSHQLVQTSPLHPMINYLPVFGAENSSYSVHIAERITDYEFSVQ